MNIKITCLLNGYVYRETFLPFSFLSTFWKGINSEKKDRIAFGLSPREATIVTKVMPLWNFRRKTWWCTHNFIVGIRYNNSDCIIRYSKYHNGSESNIAFTVLFLNGNSNCMQTTSLILYEFIYFTVVTQTHRNPVGKKLALYQSDLWCLYTNHVRQTRRTGEASLHIYVSQTLHWEVVLKK